MNIRPTSVKSCQKSTAETRPRITQLKASHEEHFESFRKLDAEILSDLVELEGVTDEQIAENLKGEIKAIITTLAELLTESQKAL